MDNNILCIKKEVLFKDRKLSGFINEFNNELMDLINSKSEFKIRKLLEIDQNFLQIIPQVNLFFDNKYFLFREDKKSEKRLISLSPIFVGGHVEEFDKNSSLNIIEQARDREIQEEVEIKSKILKKELKGFIYLNDNNPVNLVHLGVVYQYVLDGSIVDVKEENTINRGFVNKEFLESHKDELTYWSRIYLPYLI